MRRVLLAAAVLLASAGARATAAQPGPPAPPGPVGGGKYSGAVVDVSPRSITIQGGGTYHIGGRAAEGLRTFPASDLLRGGGFPTDGLSAYAYRLADVRAGDLVVVRFTGDVGTEVVTHVSITRRPGGRVPPSPAERPGGTRAYHEWRNALADLEERGIPLPERYDPAVLLRQAAERAAAGRAEADADAGRYVFRVVLERGPVGALVEFAPEPPTDPAEARRRAAEVAARGFARVDALRARLGAVGPMPRVVDPPRGSRELAAPPRLAPPRPAN